MNLKEFTIVTDKDVIKVMGHYIDFHDYDERVYIMSRAVDNRSWLRIIFSFHHPVDSVIAGFPIESVRWVAESDKIIEINEPL